MKRSKNLLRKGAALAAMSTVLVSQAPLINAFAYGEADVVRVHSSRIQIIQLISRTGFLMYGREEKKLMHRLKM